MTRRKGRPRREVRGFRIDRCVRARKVRYRDLNQATEAIAHIRRWAAPGATIPVRAYECGWCAGYHLTSQES